MREAAIAGRRREAAAAEHLRGEAAVERHVPGAAAFLVMPFAGLLLVNHFEPCEHGHRSYAAPCRDPLDDYPHC